MSMLNEAEPYIGKKVNLEKIGELFPECFIAVDKYHTDGHTSSGILVYVCKDQKELNPILVQYANNGIKLNCTYTTESKEWNGLWQL